MWSIPDEGYSRHQVCSTWPVSGITFIRYTPHDQFLE
jgi:hypothetical protein